MISTTGMDQRPCEIVPADRHRSDGVTIEWVVRDTEAEQFKAAGFESAEAAVEWATANGYEPDRALIAEYQLDLALAILGPSRAAVAIVAAFSVRQLATFGVEYRRSYESRIDGEDYCLQAAAN